MGIIANIAVLLGLSRRSSIYYLSSYSLFLSVSESSVESPSVWVKSLLNLIVLFLCTFEKLLRVDIDGLLNNFTKISFFKPNGNPKNLFKDDLYFDMNF